MYTRVLFQEAQSRNCIKWQSLWNRTKVRVLKVIWVESLTLFCIPLCCFSYLPCYVIVFIKKKKKTILKHPLFLSFCPHTVCKVFLQLSLLIWHFTFPYLKELCTLQMWTFQKPFSLYRSFVKMLNKSLISSDPWEPNCLLFPMKKYPFITTLYFLFQSQFPIHDKTFSSDPQLHNFFPVAFDAELC